MSVHDEKLLSRRQLVSGDGAGLNACPPLRYTEELT